MTENQKELVQIIRNVSNIECETIKNHLTIDEAIVKLNNVGLGQLSVIDDLVQDIREKLGINNSESARDTVSEAELKTSMPDLLDKVNYVRWDTKENIVRPLNLLDIIKFGENIKKMLNHRYVLDLNTNAEE